MIRTIAKIALVVMLSLLVVSLTSSANAFPSNPIELGKSVGAQIETVSFWGLVYPYGYRYRWHGCSSYTYVHRRYHGRTVRVRVCE